MPSSWVQQKDPRASSPILGAFEQPIETDAARRVVIQLVSRQSLFRGVRPSAVRRLGFWFGRPSPMKQAKPDPDARCPEMGSAIPAPDSGRPDLHGGPGVELARAVLPPQP